MSFQDRYLVSKIKLMQGVRCCNQSVRSYINSLVTDQQLFSQPKDNFLAMASKNVLVGIPGSYPQYRSSESIVEVRDGIDQRHRVVEGQEKLNSIEIVLGHLTLENCCTLLTYFYSCLIAKLFQYGDAQQQFERFMTSSHGVLVM